MQFMGEILRAFLQIFNQFLFSSDLSLPCEVQKPQKVIIALKLHKPPIIPYPDILPIILLRAENIS